MRHVGLFLAATVFVACSASDPEPAADAGTKTVAYATLKGTVQYHPQELKWRASLGESGATLPTLNGATLNVEDAIRAQSNSEPLMKVTLASTDGKTADFIAEHVYVKGSTLALVASVKGVDPQNPDDDSLMFSGYGLGKPPYQEVMADLPVYVVSKRFMQHLADVVGRSLDSMMEEGVVIGGASTWDHQKGVANAHLVNLLGTGPTARTVNVSDGVFYLNADLSDKVADQWTTESGTWIRLNAGSATTYTMLDKDATSYQQAGKTEFAEHLNGSRAGTVLSVFFEDLSTKPQ